MRLSCGGRLSNVVSGSLSAVFAHSEEAVCWKLSLLCSYDGLLDFAGEERSGGKLRAVRVPIGIFCIEMQQVLLSLFVHLIGCWEWYGVVWVDSHCLNS